ncbi:Reverse transcriptase zinc-binding domain [Macleaya cordata]|uniref:Reverse transcriptase zinc-binding domain n=1 Tax=Macleaya cordata TaxID=56857 RepID=A0A200PXV9_MACCD|nr:Reverse transcriptase zinc-binding domain [Macleaya cordata]
MGVDGEIQWNLDLSRRLYEWELSKAIDLFALIDNFALQDSDDPRSWRLKKSGLFSMASCYSAIHQSNREPFQNKDVWDPLVPTKIAFFAWLESHNSILTQDNMARKGMIIVNRCCLCSKGFESVPHLLLSYPVTREIWEYFLYGFGIDWVFHEDLKRMFSKRLVSHFTNAGNFLWHFLPFAIAWIIWLERNDRTLNDKEKDIHKMILIIKAILYYWALPTKLLEGFRFEDLVFKWDQVVRKG